MNMKCLCFEQFLSSPAKTFVENMWVYTDKVSYKHESFLSVMLFSLKVISLGPTNLKLTSKLS